MSLRRISLVAVVAAVNAALVLAAAACPPERGIDDGDDRRGGDEGGGGGGEGEGGVGEGEGEGEGEGDAVLSQLRAAFDGVGSVDEVSSQIGGYRAFDIVLTQPVRHGAAGGPTFTQRATLLHTSTSAPMILNTTGYSIFPGYEQVAEEITMMLAANQILIEERYFGASVPGGDDWTPLTIAEAAADHHAFVELLKPVYGAAWISTGHSKGGMTSIFHERFFPDDVDAVVAYVTPISFGAPDLRYRPWLADIGDVDCREKIHAIQRAGADQLQGVVDLLVAEDPSHSRASLENYAKVAISTFEWGFWQFYGVCDGTFDSFTIATAEDAKGFFGITTVGIADVYREFDAYTYQSRFELGYPDQLSHHLDDVFGAIDDNVDDIIGAGPWAVDPVYDGGAAMNDVAQFVSAQGDQLLFVYGGFDPWSGGAFDLGGAADSFEVFAPGANHGAFIASLSPDDQAVAVDALSRWSGVTPPAQSAFALPLFRQGLARLQEREHAIARRLFRPAGGLPH